MSRTSRSLASTALAVGLSLLCVSQALCTESTPEQRPLMLGRMTETQGNVLRYLPDKDDWVIVVRDTPLRAEEALYSDETGKAEFTLPNNSLARMGADTQLHINEVGEDLTEVDVGSGMARLVNKSPSTIVKATTPFGYVLGPPKSSFDLYVGKDSVEVISLKDKVYFVAPGEATKYDVIAGEASVVANAQETGLGDGSADVEWDAWNVERDTFWESHLEVKGDSIQYLPQELKSDSYALDENGHWEKIYYDKCDCETQVWRPTRVRSDWAPFTAGRWTEWYGDQCWVPDEPFGYVTHHYGNWINVGGAWYWAPPVVRAAAGPVSVVSVGLNWYPGRVAWFSSDEEIGWIPLAPYEPYYSTAYWGPASFVVGVGALPVIDIGTYAYYGSPVIVHQRNFYTVNNYYSTTIVRNVNVARLRTYRPAPVVHARVFRDPSLLNGRHQFTNRPAQLKPDRVVTERMRNVNAKVKETRDVNGRSVAVKAAKIPRSAEPLKKTELPRPAATLKRQNAAAPSEFPNQRQKAEGANGPAVEREEQPGRPRKPTAEQAERAVKTAREPGNVEQPPGTDVKSPGAGGKERVKPETQTAEGAGKSGSEKATGNKRETKNDAPARKHQGKGQQPAGEEQAAGGPRNASQDRRSGGRAARATEGRQETGASATSRQPASGRVQRGESVGRAPLEPEPRNPMQSRRQQMQQQAPQRQQGMPGLQQRQQMPMQQRQPMPQVQQPRPQPQPRVQQPAPQQQQQQENRKKQR